MRALSWVLAVACLAVNSMAVAAPAPPSASDKITGLIKQLSASDARERDSAQRALEEIGSAAIEPLKKAALTGNADFARLANGLAEKIRLATDRTATYAPTIVELNIKEMPLPEAIEALAKASGYPLRLAEADKLKDRKITLQTGKVPFWKAVDELCKKGNVSIVDGRTIRANGPAAPIGVGRPLPGVIRPLPAIIGPGIRIAPKAKIDDQEEKPKDEKNEEKPKDAKEEKKEEKPAVQPAPKVAPLPVAPIAPKGAFPVNPARPSTNEIIVVDQAPTFPTSIAGAFYIRGMSTSQLTKAQQRSYSIALQVIGEPKFQSFRVTNVVVTKAVDELGQKRELTDRNIKGGAAPLAPRAVSSMTLAGAAPTAIYALALTEGAKEANELKELVGTVSVQIRTTPSDIVALKELGKSKQSHHAPTAVSVKLHEFEKNADGTYTITAEVYYPVGAIAPDTAREAGWAAPGGLVGPGGAPAVLPVTAYNGSGLRLVDKSGTPLSLASIRLKVVEESNENALQALVGGLLPLNERSRIGVRTGHHVTATFKPRGDEVPSQLIFRGAKLETVNVPFELKNLPLK